jgi:Fic family protein
MLLTNHTASRDLKEAVEQGLLKMKGNRARVTYKKAQHIFIYNYLT